jgi:hypothetical protein
VQAYAETQISIGNLDLDVGDAPSFGVGCTSRVFPKHAISFIRFWDPAKPPGALQSAKTGAVKIDDSGVHLGRGPFSVDPADAGLGDPMTIHLRSITVQITSWVAKPGSPGDYVGFFYTVSPSSAEVVLDVKAGQSLTRTEVTGAGLWPPEGMFTGSQGIALPVCDPASSKPGRLDFHNSGTIPAVVSLEWGYGPGDPDCCRFFDVLVEDAASGAVLFGGPLCDLLDRPIFVSPQLDPGQSVALDIAVTLHPGESPSGDLTVPMVSRVTWWQWTSDPPGSPGAYGWWNVLEGDFEIRLMPPAASSAATSPSAATPGAETSTLTTTTPTTAPPQETTTTTTSTAPPQETTTTLTTPPPEETTTTTTTTTAPPEETTTTATTTTTTTLPLEETTTTLPPAGGDEGTVTLSGRVWEDLDGDGATVTGHAAAEPAVARVAVVVLDADGQVAARTRSDARGRYTVEGLASGRYRVTFIAPDGWGFRDPQLPITVQAQQMAGLLGVGVDQIVLDDLDSVTQTRNQPPAWRASTGFFDAGPGVEDEAADAALVRLPEAPEAGDDAAPVPGSGLPGNDVEPGETPASPIDPNSQAAKPEKPEPQTTPPAPDLPSPDDQVAPGDSANALTDPGQATAPPEDPGPEDGAAPGEGEGALP